jgi:hypothetical protein
MERSPFCGRRRCKRAVTSMRQLMRRGELLGGRPIRTRSDLFTERNE